MTLLFLLYSCLFSWNDSIKYASAYQLLSISSLPVMALRSMNILNKNRLLSAVSLLKAGKALVSQVTGLSGLAHAALHHHNNHLQYTAMYRHEKPLEALSSQVTMPFVSVCAAA